MPPVAVVVNILLVEKPRILVIFTDPAWVLTTLWAVPDKVPTVMPPLAANKSKPPLDTYMAVPLMACPLFQALLALSVDLLAARSVAKVMPPDLAVASILAPDDVKLPKATLVPPSICMASVLVPVVIVKAAVSLTNLAQPAVTAKVPTVIAA